MTEEVKQMEDMMIHTKPVCRFSTCFFCIVPLLCLLKISKSV